MNTQPEALRLADALAMGKASFTDHLTPAAAELRRQYQEITELRHATGVANMTIQSLQAQNTELLDALKKIEKLPGISSANLQARAAIAKAEK